MSLISGFDELLHSVDWPTRKSWSFLFMAFPIKCWRSLGSKFNSFFPMYHGFLSNQNRPSIRRWITNKPITISGKHMTRVPIGSDLRQFWMWSALNYIVILITRAVVSRSSCYELDLPSCKCQITFLILIVIGGKIRLAALP